MIQAACDCGAVRIGLAVAPDEVSECQCSFCQKKGVLWSYYPIEAVTIEAAEDATFPYLRGPGVSEFHTCKACGCTTHWRPTDDRTWMGVNARLMPREVREAARYVIDPGPG
jgi:hypothetical protein